MDDKNHTLDRIFLLRWAYEVLQEVTPLSGDCGALCGAACCSGGEGDGMWIFPGEEEILENEAGFVLHRSEPATVICSGRCERAGRPLSCRIFPLYPLVTRRPGEGRARVRVMVDPRANRICPLARRQRVERGFVRAVQKAARILALDPELEWYLTETGEYLQELEKLRERLM